jgi:hypothetical protein
MFHGYPFASFEEWGTLCASVLLLQVGVQQEILKWIKNMFHCLISIMMNGLSSL